MEVGQDAEAGYLQHRFNVQLPYKDRIPAESERLLAQVKEALAKFTEDTNDSSHLLRACSGQ